MSGIGLATAPPVDHLMTCSSRANGRDLNSFIGHCVRMLPNKSARLAGIRVAGIFHARLVCRPSSCDRRASITRSKEIVQRVYIADDMAHSRVPRTSLID